MTHPHARSARKPLALALALALVLASLGLAALALAAGGGLSVTITAAGKPLPGATVKLDGTPRVATADPKGEALIEGLVAGTYTVRCQAKGYADVVRRGVTVSDGQTARVTCAMTSRPPKKEKQAEASAERERSRSARPAPAASMDMELGGDLPAPPMSRARPKRMPRPAGRAAPPRPQMAFRRALPPPPPRMPAPEMNTEEYRATDEADFKSALQDPLSTFSIDVDTASYANARRFIEQMNRLPPPDAVRVEEFINYFDYDYPQPKGPHPFAIHTEVSTAPWNPAHRLVHIGIQGKKIDTAALPAQNLVFLLDVSGSMSSPEKLPLLKQAFRMLVENLRPHDKVAIVVYAGAAGLVLPSTPGKQRQAILDAIDRLSAGGSTAGGAGIKLAYQVARDNFVKGGNNRIILATDGDFNVGASSEGDLVRLIEKERASGVFLTILGFGRGNYKDAKMEMLSNKGNGNAAYIDSVFEAKKVLVTEMGGTLMTIAKDVKIQVEFNPAKVKGYRLIGYENRALANRDFDDDKKDAGELGAGHTVTVLYEIVPADSDAPLPGVDALKYQTREISDAAKQSPEMLTIKLRYKQPDGDESTLVTAPLVDRHVAFGKTSDDFRFSAAVATFAQALRGSQYTREVNLADVIEMARRAEGADREGYRGGFVQLVRKAQTLGGLPR